MVSIQKTGGVFNQGILDLVGLSTDTKPTNINKILSVEITNGSAYIEMDTSKVFIFDSENEIWYQL